MPLTDARLRIVARPFAGGREIEVELGAKRRLDLDSATLPGFGAHRAHVVTDETRPIAVEWRPDGDDEETPLSIHIGAGHGVAEIGWISASPFRPGVVWRVVRDGTPERWSAPVPPQDGLVIEIGGRAAMDTREEPLVVDGISIEARSGDGRMWNYIPERPTIQTGPGGTPMLTVLEAGATAFLQCTVQVGLDDAVCNALLTRLKEKRPQAESLEAAALSVERIALEAKIGSEWQVVAEGKGSGLPPWTAALMATLEPGTLAAIKAAVAGQTDCARRGRGLSLPGSTAAFRRAEFVGEQSNT